MKLGDKNRNFNFLMNYENYRTELEFLDLFIFF